MEKTCSPHRAAWFRLRTCCRFSVVAHDIGVLVAVTVCRWDMMGNSDVPVVLRPGELLIIRSVRM